MARKRKECYPDYTAEVAHLNAGNQITPQLLGRIIRKHRGNACFNQKLCERYQVIEEGVPIFRRRPRFSSGSQITTISLKSWTSRRATLPEVPSPTATATPRSPARSPAASGR